MTEENQTNEKKTAKFIRNVLIKGILLFLILNFAVALIPPGGKLGNLSLYNVLLPGRIRLPFGENPEGAYNLSLYDLEALFASHEISAGAKPGDEFRIVLIGDSATWGTLLQPQDTLSGLINQDNLTSCDGRTVRTYNLAYPSMSLTKDLLILDEALTYEPDLIIWPVTLQSFPRKIQLNTPLVANNPQRVQPLILQLDLTLDAESEDFVEPTFWDRTLIGRRRAIFDALQLQFYGAMWAATGIDQTYPDDYTPAQRDFESGDYQFLGWEPTELGLDLISLDILYAGANLAGEIPVLIVNEPILISEGENSDLRYNFFYPRWAYDQYRLAMAIQSMNAAWDYLDLWNAIPQEEFTNSAVHLSPEGSQLYYRALKPTIERAVCP
jgi:hypothetical protein